MTQCPEELVLLDLTKGILEAGLRDSLDIHLDSCDRCRIAVAQLANGSIAAASGRQPDDLPPGTEIGRYTIQARLGAGGMGVVYRALDRKLQRPVALKFLAESPTHAAESLHEASAMAKLAHPNIIAVYDSEAHGDSWFVVMEYVDGPTLQTYGAGEIPRSVRVGMLVELAKALAVAHAASIVHRDVKPQNILVGSDGRARIGDFGLAAFGPDHGQRSIVGTPAYMAPEVARGEPATEQSDQYSFAKTAWEFLFGELPRSGRPIKSDGDDAWIKAALLRALEPDPALRFSNMNALATALQPLPRRKKAGVMLATFVVASGAAAAVLLSSRGRDTCAEALPPAVVAASQTLGSSFATWRQEFADTRTAVCSQPDPVAKRAQHQCLDQIGFRAAMVLADEATPKHPGWLAAALREAKQPSECLLAGQPALLGTATEKQIAQELAIAHSKQAREQLLFGDGRSLLTRATETRNPWLQSDAQLLVSALQQNLANYTDADTAARDALNLAEANGLREVAATAWLHRLGIAGEQSNYQTAQLWVPLVQAAIERAGNPPRLVAWFEHNRGLLALGLGDLVSAKQHLDRALAMRKSVGESAELARTYSAHGQLARATGDFVASAQFHRDALQLNEKLFAAKSAAVARDVHNLAGALRSIGKLDEAEQLYRRALATKIEVNGEDHPSVGLTHNSLGLVLLAQKQVSDAKQSFAKAAEILRRAKHHDWALATQNLAYVALADKQFNDSYDLAVDALAVYLANGDKNNDRGAETAMIVAESAVALSRETQAAKHLALVVQLATPAQADLLARVEMLRGQQPLQPNRQSKAAIQPPSARKELPPAVVVQTEPKESTDAPAPLVIKPIAPPTTDPPPTLAKPSDPVLPTRSYGSTPAWN